MILDLTRRPMLMLHEQCPQSIVVRTFQTKDVNGRLSVKRDTRVYRASIEKMIFIEPGASLKRGEITCMETRIDLVEALDAYRAANAGELRWDRVDTVVDGVPHVNLNYRMEKPKLDLVPEPYEVATGAKDAITGQIVTWRVAISIQQRKALWLVTVRDISEEKAVDLCTIGVYDLDPRPRLRDDLPLLRLMKTIVGKPQNAWEHLLADD